MISRTGTHTQAGAIVGPEPGLVAAAMRRTLRLAVCVLAISGAWTTAAQARVFALSGEFVQEVPGIPTGATADPDNPTFVNFTFAGTNSTVTGTWVGQLVTTEAAGRINVLTGETTGSAETTFLGSTDEGGFGTVEIHGTFRIGALGPNGTQPLYEEARIGGGTGDFEGSHGRMTFTGDLTGGIGRGRYEGRWVLPGSSTLGG